ncbi:hypothetical protein [Roseisolibacter sp. H3M3-2]|uniref:hypothetical protein n=1 Tax=Roseisolibacter sp. H3M3-2 TaxID=3031323 RepID=UPI0023DBF7B6|nr:hypothetical protein [Roseisolibacter sp. H3M3-2]MDF1501986.1 hypothetical protein [Roseisolibacter sp. H3M3-2]
MRGAGLALALALVQDPVGLTTHETDARAVALLRAAGVRHARTTLYWDRWAAEPAYRAAFAAGVRRVDSAGIALTVVVHAAPPGSGYDARARVYRAFAEFVAARAGELPQVDHWQLWNEQDAPGWTEAFGAGRVPLRQQGRHYAEMLREAYPRIKRASPRALVVVGGLAGPDDSLAVFLRGVYDGAGPFDVLAVHAYGPPVVTAARARGDRVRAEMRARGDARPLWLTEFGIAAGTMRHLWRISARDRQEARRAAEWRDLAEWNDRTRTFDRLVGYVLHDGEADGYGVVAPGRAATRPVFAWLRERNAARRSSQR